MIEEAVGLLTEEDIKRMSEVLAEAIVGVVGSGSGFHVEVQDGCGSGVVEHVDVDGIVVDLVSSSALSLWDWISNLLSAIGSLLDGIKSAIVSALYTVGEWVFNNFIKPAVDGVYNFLVNTVKPVLDSIFSTVSGVVSSVVGQVSSVVSGAVSSIISEVWSAISGVVNTVVEGVEGVVSWIVDAVRDFIDGLSISISLMKGDVLSAIGTAVSNLLTDISSSVWGMLDDAVASLTGYLDGVKADLTALLNGVSSSLTAVFESSIAGLKVWFDTSVSWLTSTVNELYGVVGEGFGSVLESLNAMFSSMAVYFEGLTRMISDGFTGMSMAFTGFVNAIAGLPMAFAEILGNFASWIWTAVPNWLSGVISGIGDFFLKVLPMVLNPIIMIYSMSFKSPTFDPFFIMDMIKTYVGEIPAWLVKEFMKGLNPVYGMLLSIVEFIASGVTKVFGSLFGFVRLISDPFQEFLGLVLLEFLPPVVQSYFKPMIEHYATMHPEKTAEEVGKAFATITTEVLTYFSSFIFGHVGIRAIISIMRILSQFLRDLGANLDLALQPFGIGVGGRFSFKIAFGEAIKEFISDVDKWFHELYRGFIYGFSIWGTQFWVYPLNYSLRNLLPVNIPEEENIIEFTRRAMPSLVRMTTTQLMKNYLALQGYADEIIKWMVEVDTPHIIFVTDRFGSRRVVPLSLVYRLPSSSDVARMMVRDIFASIEDFQRLFLATGMHPDIGVLYYLLHFRYPPPERLWAFTMRGVSGLLWAGLTREEADAIREEAEKLRAKVPVSPCELNFASKTLFEALKTYMKWHDFARFGWIEGFTSDNLIYIDTLADIPSKIDQRWMVRWGLYELLSSRGVTISSPVSEFRTKTIDSAPASDVIMDLVNFCRTLQATGLHPDWIPITAVAETMNALTEERTLLRTGFMNLFERGFYDVKALEKLMSGFVMASFRVAFFDSQELAWKTGWINHPVMFLPAERKLLELRALMDRTLEVLRDIQRDILTGYQEWIIRDYDEVKSKMVAVVDAVNQSYAKDYKVITGVELPDELRVSYVEDFFKPYVDALATWRDIYTIRRVRYWASRWLGWVIYRVASGTMYPEDVQQLVDYIKEYAKLTDYEVEFFNNVMNLLMEISRREYIPTIMSLASICEVIPEARQFFDDVVRARRIPQEWVPLWARYVDLKPIIDEVRRMYSRAEDLYVYYMITEEDYMEVLGQLRTFGYTEKEIELMLTSANYERFKYAWREVIGDVDRMMSLAEYSPRARAYALATIYKMIDSLPLSDEEKDELKAMWEQYIRVRPVYSEVKSYVTDLINAYVRGTITREVFEAELESLREWGLDENEIMFYKAKAGIRKAYHIGVTIG